MRDDDTTPATDPGSAPAERLADPTSQAATNRRGAASVVRRERDLDVAVGEAWPLLSTPEGLEQWLGERIALEIAEGARGEIQDGDELLQVEIESIEPGRRLSLRWWSETRVATVVDLTLEPLDDARSRLVVIEVPLPALVVPNVLPSVGRAQRPPGAQLAGPQALALA